MYPYLEYNFSSLTVPKMRTTTFRIVKCLTFALNIVTACGAITLIGFGVAYLVKEQDAVKVFGESFSFGALTTTIGGIALFTSILGCLAVFLDNRILLTIYSCTMFLLFVVQLSLGIMALTKVNHNFLDNVRKLLRETFDDGNYYYTQRKFECCGVDGPDDYNGIRPVSCCEDQTSLCLEPFDVGCATAFEDVMGQYIKIIGIVGLIAAVFQVLGAFSAFVTRNRSTRFV